MKHAEGRVQSFTSHVLSYGLCFEFEMLIKET